MVTLTAIYLKDESVWQGWRDLCRFPFSFLWHHSPLLSIIQFPVTHRVTASICLEHARNGDLWAFSLLVHLQLIRWLELRAAIFADGIWCIFVRWPYKYEAINHSVEWCDFRWTASKCLITLSTVHRSLHHTSPRSLWRHLPMDTTSRRSVTSSYHWWNLDRAWSKTKHRRLSQSRERERSVKLTSLLFVSSEQAAHFTNSLQRKETMK